jgi:hypothetical protein
MSSAGRGARGRGPTLVLPSAAMSTYLAPSSPRFYRLALAFVATLSACLAHTAAVQAAERVLVLLPERFQVEEEVAERLFGALEAAVERHPDFELEPFEPQTLAMIGEAVGCPDDREDCLAIIGETLEVDLVVFGEIGGAERTVLTELTVWDVAAGEARRVYSRAVEGERAELDSWLPVLARGAVYGDVGRVHLVVTPAGAEVRLDAQPLGTGTEWDLDGFALGPHVIDVSADGYFDRREVVRVDLQPIEVSVELVPTTVEVGVTSGRLWTWVALGTGLAATGAGVAFGLASQSTQETFDEEAGQARVDLDALGDLQDTGEGQATLSNVFFGIGAASLAAAVVLFFVEGAGESDAAPGSGVGDRSARPGDLIVSPFAFGVHL